MQVMKYRYRNRVRKALPQLMICFLLIIALSGTTAAQSYLTIVPAYRYPKSNAEQVYIADKRVDSGNQIGTVIVERKQSPLLVRTTFWQELQQFFGAELNSGQQLAVLVSQFAIREFEPIGFDGKPYGSFSYAADYFLMDSAGKYRLVGSVDTQVWVVSYNLHKKLFAHVSGVLAQTIRQSLDKPLITAQQFSAEQIKNLEPNWRQQYPPFVGALPKDACFQYWNDFLELRSSPDLRAELKGRAVKCYEQKGKGMSRYRMPLKVVAIDGRYYYRMEHTYRLIERIGNDFWIKAPVYRLRPDHSSSAAVIAIVAVGVYAQAIPFFNAAEIAYYDCKLNANTGTLVPVLELPKKPDESTYLTIQ